MAGKSPSRSKILNDTLDLMTLLTRGLDFCGADAHFGYWLKTIQKGVK